MILKIIKMRDKACVEIIIKLICLLHLKRKLFNFIEGVKIHMFCVIQVDSCHFPYSLSIGWTKLYIVRQKNIG